MQPKGDGLLRRGRSDELNDLRKQIHELTARLDRCNVTGGESSVIMSEDSTPDDAKLPEAPPVVPDYSSCMNTHAVALAKLMVARDGWQYWRAACWVLLTLATSAMQVVFAVAMLASLSWGKCNATTQCKLGMACISYVNPDGSHITPTCEDCYFLAERAGALEFGAELYPHVFVTAHDINASEFCLEQLDAIAPSMEDLGISEPSFATCLYAQDAYLTMSGLEYVVVYVAMVVVALALTQEWVEWSQLRWLRRRQLPCAIVWPAGWDARAAFFWTSAWLLRVAEVTSMHMIIPITPAIMLMLLFSEGTGAASILLNGLSAVFILTVDNFVPAALLSATSLQTVSDVLSAADVRSIQEEVSLAAGSKDARGQRSLRITRDTHNAEPFGSRVMPIFHALSMAVCFASVGNVKCELFIHQLYYRLTLANNLWGGQAVRSLITALISAVKLCGPNSTTYGPGQRLREGAAVAYAAAEGFLDALLAAVLLNIMYWYCINCLYYDGANAAATFPDYVYDIFGICARGPYWNGDCIPMAQHTLLGVFW
jgi:hypothetical protein